MAPLRRWPVDQKALQVKYDVCCPTSKAVFLTLKGFKVTCETFILGEAANICQK